MAALGFVDTIGLIGTGLGIIQLGLDNFVPDQEYPKGATVDIKAGAGFGAADNLDVPGLQGRCGHTWFESQEVAGRLDDGSLYRPSCTWLDGNHDGNIENAALKFATYAYGNDTSHVTLDQDACASTLFGAQEDEIIDAPVDPSLAKRSTTSSRTRLPWMENKLVVSNIDSHSAANLCNSETSWGPDFVDSHGKLCDMGTKTLYTLCSNENVDGCVEVSTGSSNGRWIEGAHKAPYRT
ncbi:hypothetical protein E4T47_02309 [Aureobasidium subglaciale]|nr:hypothetical protein E4T47_02309 [Aureobasidium subglaciale]